MISRIFFASLFLGMYSTGSSLSCKWIVKDPGDKMCQFSLHNKQALGLLDMMITNTTKDAEIEHNVAFPNRLYRKTSKATAEDKLAFTVQILEKLFALFEEDHSSASWEENTVENFLNIVNKQAEELRSCIGSHSYTTQKVQRRTEIHFKRLLNKILKKNGYSAEAWETIRNITKDHLSQCGFLVNSLGNAH
ncbi:interferon a3-like [Astatotilapia calliptera]|uniref:interferon a3-like n=1 Tax=Astatotilapia calliptera TaxID=8154 RepID=UPI000E41DCDD|nr:interferon a3-like [Astatotilapia calliptera]